VATVVEEPLPHPTVSSTTAAHAATDAGKSVREDMEGLVPFSRERRSQAGSEERRLPACAMAC
jgi:hypothetical protein